MAANVAAIGHVAASVAAGVPPALAPKVMSGLVRDGLLSQELLRRAIDRCQTRAA